MHKTGARRPPIEQKGVAVFVDRDGTMAPDVGYCRRPEDLNLFPGAVEAVRSLNQAGFKVIVVSNQSGIARGYFTHQKLAEIHTKMEQDLAQEGARLDGIYYCPHHPDDGCDCRKPKPMMLFRAAHDHNIDLVSSFMVGDGAMDIEAGKAAGCKTVLVKAGSSGSQVANGANTVAKNLLEAAQWIIATRTAEGQSPGGAGALFPRVSVVVPTLNEEANLPHVLPRIPLSVKEVLLVDGHSADNTVTIAPKLHPKVRVIHQEGKGKGNALRSGFAHASGDIIVTLDADGSMRPEEMGRFLEPLFNGYDFAKGTRFKGGGGSADMPKHRIFGNWAFARLTNLLHGSKYTDLAYGYNAFWKRCLERVTLRSNGFDIETETAIRVKKAGLKVVEVPSYEDARLNGNGNLRSLSDGWLILRAIVRELLNG